MQKFPTGDQWTNKEFDFPYTVRIDFSHFSQDNSLVINFRVYNKNSGYPLVFHKENSICTWLAVKGSTFDACNSIAEILNLSPLQTSLLNTIINFRTDEYWTKWLKKGLLGNSVDNYIEKAARKLPGHEFKVECPKCDESYEDKLHQIIIHLNDSHRMSREEIADWLEVLEERDGIDLTF